VILIEIKIHILRVCCI